MIRPAIARVRRPAVWAAGLLIVLSIGLSAVPVMRRMSDRADAPQSLPDMEATVEPEATDLAPILDFAPFGSAAAPPEPEGEAPETDLGLVLLGVTVAVPATQSRAIIGGGDTPISSYAVGDGITGTARLAEVHPGHVVLDIDGQPETLSFDAPEAVGQADTQPDTQPDAQPDGGPDLRNLIPRDDEEEASGTSDPAAEPDDKQASDDADPDAVLADYVARFEDDPEAVLDGLGLVPTDEGYEVSDDAASVVRLAGLQPGDLLTHVNGQKVGDMPGDQVYLDEVAASGRARIEIRRDGQTIVLTFPLR